MRLSEDDKNRLNELRTLFGTGVLTDDNIKEFQILVQKEYYYKQQEDEATEVLKIDDTRNLTKLGSKETKYIYDSPNFLMLETFPNQYPEREYITQFIFDEFTSLCPKTGQPDFAKITVEYVPVRLCIETKSLKVYFLAYRQERTFMETLTNRILEDCVRVCEPRQLRIISNFNARGGTLINVIAEYVKKEE